MASDGGPLDPALLADRPVEERLRPALVGDLGGAGGRRGRPGASGDGAGGARADADRRAAGAARAADRLVPAGADPPARRAGPAHRLPGGAGGRDVRGAAAATGSRCRSAPSTWCRARWARAGWTVSCAGRCWSCCRGCASCRARARPATGAGASPRRRRRASGTRTTRRGPLRAAPGGRRAGGGRGRGDGRGAGRAVPEPAARRARTPSRAAGVGRGPGAARRGGRPAGRRRAGARLVVAALRRAGRHRPGPAQRAAGAAGGHGGQGPGGGGGVRTTIGPRQVLLPLPGDDEDAAARHRTLARLGLKVAHPDAVHPLLEKLGATPATPRAVLTTPQVRAAVANSLDATRTPTTSSRTSDGGRGSAGRRGAGGDGARPGPGRQPRAGRRALARRRSRCPTRTASWRPAGELVFPGSAFERVIREGELAACATRSWPSAGASSR